jgi:hypothetical protein
MASQGEYKEDYIGKCRFCPLGMENRRAVIRVTRDNKTVYTCGLGEIGKECIIPKIYNGLDEVSNMLNERLSRQEQKDIIF